MLKQVETEGETLDKAIANALNLLGVDRDKVSLDVLAEEKAGLLGFGRRNARVRATMRTADADADADAQNETAADAGSGAAARAGAAGAPVPKAGAAAAAAAASESGASAGAEASAGDQADPAEAAHAASGEFDAGTAEARRVSVEALEEILRLMGVDSRVVVKPGRSAAEFVLDIQGDSGALLIGRRGQILDALQHIISRIAAKKLGPDGPQPAVDVEDYRGRRVRTLEDMALRLGEKAKRSRKPQSLDDLNARDRRVVHMALKDDPWLTTRSQGDGAFRRLLIVPKGDRAPDGDGAGDDR